MLESKRAAERERAKEENIEPGREYGLMGVFICSSLGRGILHCALLPIIGSDNDELWNISRR